MAEYLLAKGLNFADVVNQPFCQMAILYGWFSGYQFYTMINILQRHWVHGSKIDAKEIRYATEK